MDGDVSVIDGGEELFFQFLLHGDALKVQGNGSIIFPNGFGHGSSTSYTSGGRVTRVNRMDE